VRLSLAGDVPSALGWLLGAALVPALALACGVWTGGAKCFEVTYLFLWYVGPMHHVAEMDYTGVTAVREGTLWLIYIVVTLGFFALAWVGRSRQARN